MRVFVISKTAGWHQGGEGIKAVQYFEELLRQGIDAVLVTRAPCRAWLAPKFPADRLRFVADGPVRRLVWRSRVLRWVLPLQFHISVARMLRGEDPAACVLHYLCPISPMQPRFLPRGFRSVIGPLSGNIFHPPALRHREPRRARLARWTYLPLQALMGFLVPDKRRARTVLVSGGQRTMRALRWAGCHDGQMVNVVDAGVSSRVSQAPRISHAGRNTRFVTIGRLVGYKGTDLAIRALRQTPDDYTLTVFGDGGERPRLERLVRELGLTDRVRFAGWLENGELAEALNGYRAFVFPTLAEANGIVMQEAMMLGLPVIALRWGGPAALADDTCACFVEPGAEGDVVGDIARHMIDLAEHGGKAEQISMVAHARAQAQFRWPVVAASWARHYVPSGSEFAQIPLAPQAKRA